MSAAAADVARRAADMQSVPDAHVDAALAELLEESVALLQTPHALDGERPGSTLSFGVDALRAWCAAALENAPRASPALAAADVWETAVARMYAALALPSATANRVRGLLLSMLTLHDALGSDRARELFRAAATDLDAPASLHIYDALLARYGLAALPTTARAFFAQLLAGVQAGRGSASRRAHVAMALIHATRDTSAWPEAWLPSLAASLVRDERAAEHVLSHVLPPLLDTEPAALRPLLDAIDASDALAEARMRARMAVLRAAKLRDLCYLVDGEEQEPGRVCVSSAVLDTCLSSASPRLHVAALALAVDAKTPAAPFAPAELRILRRFFAESLQMPSSVARKDSIAFFVKLLVRLRTSANTLVKRGEAAQATCDVVASLWDSIVLATHQGAPYACSVLGVSLLLLLIEGVHDLPPEPVLDSCPLKDAIRALHKAKKTYPSGTHLPGVRASPALVARLLQLATTSTYEDVQDTAVLVLVRLRHVDAAVLPTAFVCEQIVAPSLALLPAPKEADAHAGVQLLRLYDLCAEKGAVVRHVAAAAGVCASNGSDPTLLELHMALLDRHLERARGHLATAAQTDALHGTLAALAYLVSRADVVPVDALEQRITDVWALVEAQLCTAAPEGGGPTEEAAPDGVDEATDSSPQQCVLSFAWRAVKEAAGLLEALVLARPTHTVLLQRAHAHFLTWLLRMRHRGAFSTVYPRYASVARVLLRHRDAAIAALPTAWLHELLKRVDHDGTSISTTRRSAGVGFAVLALLSAHTGRQLASETATVVARLLAMADVRTAHEKATHVPETSALDASEIRTIHALNVVRVLVMDGSMASAMRGHLGAALARAVEHFASPHWSVRNASMMLFAAIATRHFGIRAFQAPAEPAAPTLDTLLAGHAALGNVLVCALMHASQRIGAEDLADVGHGSALYAVLLLLSRLRGDGVPRAAALAGIEPCLRSANEAIRSLAAQCMAQLLPENERTAVAQRVALEASLREQNALHGALLFLRACGAGAALGRRLDLLEHNPCAVTCAAFLEAAPDAAVGGWLARLWAALLDGDTSSPSISRLVRDPFVVWLLPTALRVSDAHGVLPPVPRLLDPLQADLCFATLTWLGTRVGDASLYAPLRRLVLSQGPPDVRTAAAHALGHTAPALPPDDSHALAVCALVTEHASLRDALLPLLARCPMQAAACLRIWERCTRNDAPLTSRLGVARALRTAPREVDAFAADMLVLRLLHDDDAGVRDAACAAVSACEMACSRNVLPLGPLACTERMWAQLSAADDERWREHVWYLLTSELGRARAASSAAALFPAEADNQYYDRVADVLRAYRWLAARRASLPRMDLEAAGRPVSYLAALQRALVMQLACVVEPEAVCASAAADALDELLVPISVLAPPTPRSDAAEAMRAPLRIA